MSGYKNYILIAALLIATACSKGEEKSLADEVEANPVSEESGKRYSVLDRLGGGTEQDRKARNMDIMLDKPVRNSTHHHQEVAAASHMLFDALDGGGVPRRISVTDVGGAPDNKARLTSAPVIDGNNLFTLDGGGVVRAFDISDPQNPRSRWTLDITREDEREYIGGNISYGGGKIFFTSGNGEVMAIDAAGGERIWSKSFNMPIKSAPAYKSGRVYFFTSASRMYCLDGPSGELIWSHQGIASAEYIAGVVSPIFADAGGEDIVIAAYPSGDVYALNSRTGKERWSIALRRDARQKLSAVAVRSIDATPVLYKGSVYLASNSGNFAVVDVASGQISWTAPLSVYNPPVVSGNAVFVATTQGGVMALSRKDGGVIWSSSLPVRDDGDPVSWAGPSLASGMLLFSGSNGHMKALSYKDGEEMFDIEIPPYIYLPPVISSNGMWLLNNRAELVYYDE